MTPRQHERGESLSARADDRSRISLGLSAVGSVMLVAGLVIAVLTMSGGTSGFGLTDSDANETPTPVDASQAAGGGGAAERSGGADVTTSADGEDDVASLDEVGAGDPIGTPPEDPNSAAKGTPTVTTETSTVTTGTPTTAPGTDGERATGTGTATNAGAGQDGQNAVSQEEREERREERRERQEERREAQKEQQEENGNDESLGADLP